jgi:hypothetical protein
MGSLASLTLDIIEMLYGMAQIERPIEDTLKTAVSAANDVTWQFDTAIWKRGDYAEYWKNDGTEGEIVILAADYTVGADVTVRRAQRGTTAAASYAIGDVFLHNPTFPVATIQRFINNLIDTDLAPHVFYLTHRSLTWDEDDDHTAYPLNANDFDVVTVYQVDLGDADSLSGCTFAQATDTWTCTSHGLAVGDHLVCTEAGSALPAEYAEDTHYWVLTVPTANTFTLGTAADASSPVNGTANSTAGWTFEKRTFSHHPFPRGWWETLTPTSTTVVSTGQRLRLKTIFDEEEPVYYLAKTRPSSSAISSLPTDILEMIPWGVCAKLLMGTRLVPPRQDFTRRVSDQDRPDEPIRDYAGFMAEFLRLRRQYRMKMQRELGAQQQKPYRHSRPRGY